MIDTKHKTIYYKLILLFVTAFLVVVWHTTSKRKTGNVNALLKQNAFSYIPLTQLHTIIFSDAYGRLTVQKKDGQWVLKERLSYPANSVRINETIISLKNLKLVQKIPLEEVDWPKLQLLDPDQAGPNAEKEYIGSRVDLIGDGYRESLIAGKLQSSHSDAAMVFGNAFDGRQIVRLLKNDSVYIVDGALSHVNSLVSNWVHPDWVPQYRNKEISYYKDYTKQWEITRTATNSPYSLVRDNTGDDTPDTYLPRLSQKIDYAFASVLVKDIALDDTSEVKVRKGTYFDVVGFDENRYKLFLGNPRPATDHAKALHNQSSGVMHNTFFSSWRLAELVWPDSHHQKRSKPPLANYRYLISAPLLEQFMVNKEELVVFERISPMVAK